MTPSILVPSPDAMAELHNYIIMQVSHFLWNVVMAALLAILRVCVLAPWLDSGEIAHRSGTINGVPRPRRIEIPCEYR